VDQGRPRRRKTTRRVPDNFIALLSQPTYKPAEETWRAFFISACRLTGAKKDVGRSTPPARKVSSHCPSVRAVERDRGLPDLSARGERAAGACHGKIAVHRRPRERGEPAERVPAVRDGGVGCRLPSGLAHGSPCLVSEVITRPGAHSALTRPAAPDETKRLLAIDDPWDIVR
jgi:hypothetical protein